MSLIGYARVSTADQDPALQHDALIKAGADPDRLFTDEASGSLRERPQLTRCLEYLRPGDTLVVWKLDRLGRSLVHLIETVTALGERGIGFRSLTEGFDTTTAGGKLLFHVLGALAEFERTIIRERTMAGLASARARGRKGGRREKLDAGQQALIRELYGDGKGRTVTALAKSFKVSRPTIYRVLELNPDSEAAAASSAIAAPSSSRR